MEDFLYLENQNIRRSRRNWCSCEEIEKFLKENVNEML